MKLEKVLILIVMATAVLTTGCKKKTQGSTEYTKRYFLMTATGVPGVPAACDGEKVELVIRGYSAYCNSQDCKNGEMPFSTAVEEGAELVDCSALHATVEGWGNKEIRGEDTSWNANWVKTTTGVYDRNECTLKLAEPIPDTVDKGYAVIPRERQILIHINQIDGLDLYRGVVNINCPAAD